MKVSAGLRAVWSRGCAIPLALAAALLTGAMACGEEPSGPDGISPRIIVVFPTAESFDRDGDGLLDLELRFDVSDAEVDPASLELMANGQDLLETWRVDQLDTERLVVEETVEGLLPGDVQVITVTVDDPEGDRQRRDVEIDLPFAVLHDTIPLVMEPGRRVEDVAISPDGERLFAVDESSDLLVIGLKQATLTTQVPGPIRDLEGLAYDDQLDRVYAVSFALPGLVEFDGLSGAFLRLIPTSEGAFVVALSNTTNRAFIPLEVESLTVSGFLSVVDRGLGIETDVIDSGVRNNANPGTILGTHGVALTEDERKLFVPTASEGILVYDLVKQTLGDVIDLRENDPRQGASGDVALTGGKVYAAVFRDFFSVGSAVYRIDARTHVVEAIRDLGVRHDINRIEASPDGSRLFVSVQSGSRGDHEFPTILMRLPDLTILERMKGLGSDFGYRDAAWHPDGKRVYVAAHRIGGENFIAVYLVRP